MLISRPTNDLVRILVAQYCVAHVGLLIFGPILVSAQLGPSRAPYYWTSGIDKSRIVRSGVIGPGVVGS
jgi:hypothetical protein